VRPNTDVSGAQKQLCFAEIKQKQYSTEHNLPPTICNILGGHCPDPDLIVGETTIECLAVSRPCNRNTLRFPRLLAYVCECWFELVNNGSESQRMMRDSVKWDEQNQTDLLSRSKILTQLAVAAQSQYRLGENTRALTTSPASSEYRCFPSLRSQSIVMPSFPPEAAREPSGDTETALM
jgi:hypothetical protein